MSMTVERLIELLQEQPPHRLVAIGHGDEGHATLAHGEVDAVSLEDGDMSPVVVIR